MTPQQQLSDLQARANNVRRIVLDYRESIERGHVPTPAELDHLQAMLDSLRNAERLMEAANSTAHEQLKYVTAAPNN